jgi:hypothetical protein
MASCIIAHPALARVFTPPFDCGDAAGPGVTTVGRVRP